MVLGRSQRLEIPELLEMLGRDYLEELVGGDSLRYDETARCLWISGHTEGFKVCGNEKVEKRGNGYYEMIPALSFRSALHDWFAKIPWDLDAFHSSGFRNQTR